MKLCLSCMRKIPLLAGRCPYCRDDRQEVHGRIILIVIAFIAVFVLVEYKDEVVRFIFSNDQQQVVSPEQTKNNEELSDLLDEI